MRSSDIRIKELQLAPHPEGGFFRETWRSSGSYPFSDHSAFSGERAYATSIYYLLRATECSRLHKIKSDELWFFHEGCPLRVYLLDEAEGTVSSFTLGNNSPGHVLQGAVRANTWFGAMPLDPGSEEWSLVSCVVAPGFDFRDFSFADRRELQSKFPLHRDLIERLT